MRKTVILLILTCFVWSGALPSGILAQTGERATVSSDLSVIHPAPNPVVSNNFPQEAFPKTFDPLPWTGAPTAGPLGIEYDATGMSTEIARALVSLGDENTKLAPSHLGHPGYQDAAFLYDKAVDALVLQAAGASSEAEGVLDYFAAKLQIPMSEVKRYADANGIYGMLKLVPTVDNPKAVGFINAFNVRSKDAEGEGQLEYWTTPGPTAFMIMAFLKSDRKKYLSEAMKLGEALLAMQRADGAVVDGDRNDDNIFTEPHMDSYSAFLMLYELTGDQKWKDAAEKAWDWFDQNVYRLAQDTIFRGTQSGSQSEVFATDAYSWTMAGRGGERLSLDALERLTDRMLRRSLSKVTLELPDGKTKTVTLVDFADGQDMRIIADRGGFHPMGSVEWIGGVILALQKNAVRFWEAGDPKDRAQAVFYKAMAEFFSKQAMDAFYSLDGMKGLISFYATGQWIATGHGWRTPYFYVKDPNGNPVVKGGSTVSSWLVLPLKRSNPFKLDDHYGVIYDAIPVEAAVEKKASEYIASIVEERSYVETVPQEMDESASEIPELWRYNQNMFRSFVAGNYYESILWAKKVVNNSGWVSMARDQQKRKEREVGGLVAYPWGTPVNEAKDEKSAVQRYAILNEVGAAMWGLAVSYYKLDDMLQAKAWIRSVIETVPYHQIYAPNGPGYWNAVVSWETNPGGTFLDAEMGAIYREVLSEMGRSSALPKAFSAR